MQCCGVELISLGGGQKEQSIWPWYPGRAAGNKCEMCKGDTSDRGGKGNEPNITHGSEVQRRNKANNGVMTVLTHRKRTTLLPAPPVRGPQGSLELPGGSWASKDQSKGALGLKRASYIPAVGAREPSQQPQGLVRQNTHPGYLFILEEGNIEREKYQMKKKFCSNL